MHNISEVSDKVSGKILIMTSKDVLERLINSDNSSLKCVNGYMKSCCSYYFYNYSYGKCYLVYTFSYEFRDLLWLL